MRELPHHATAFGIRWQSDIALDAFDGVVATPGERPQVTVAACRCARDRPFARKIAHGSLYPDGVRLGWPDAPLFDMIDGEHIEYLPPQGWSGELPIGFYSTIAALTLAWRGLIPLHASTVAIDGQAVIVAGPSSAGKSTTAAALMLAGAQLVSDDLTVISVPSGPGPALVYRGRPSMRLHRETAARIPATAQGVPMPDARGKLEVRPCARHGDEPLPLAGVLLLGRDAGPLARFAAASAMPAQLFRPNWMTAIPRVRERFQALMTLPSRVRVAGLPTLTRFGESDLRRHAEMARQLIFAERPSLRPPSCEQGDARLSRLGATGGPR